MGPIGPGELLADDFETLLSYELRKRTGPVVEALVGINPSVQEYDQYVADVMILESSNIPHPAHCDRNTYAHLVSMASSVLSASQVPDPSEAGLFDAPPRPRQRNYRLMGGKYSYVMFEPNTSRVH